MCGQTITLPLLISFFYQLYYNVSSLIGLKITMLLCLLLSFLHNRIPCTHNAWATDNLTSLDWLFYPLQISLKGPKITLELLFSTNYLQKWNFIFTLRKTGPAKTGAGGLFRQPCIIMIQNRQILHFMWGVADYTGLLMLMNTIYIQFLRDAICDWIYENRPYRHKK